MRLWTLFAAASVVLAMTSPALACSLPKLTPEERAAATSAHQADAWDTADLVFVARVEQRRTQAAGDWKDAPQVTLMPLTSLKGQAGPWQFELGATDRTPCGIIPEFSAIRGLGGEDFVIFVKGDTPMQEAVIDTVHLVLLVEPRALAALKAAE